MIKQLLNIIDQIDINEIGIKHKFQEEVKRYNLFQSRVLKVEGKEKSEQNIDIKSYMKYLLKEGSVSEKRETLSCIRSRILVTRKIVTVEKL